MAASEIDFSGLVAEVYEAALDADAWQSIVERLGGGFGDAKITLWLEDRQRGDGAVLGYSGYDWSFLESYGAYYARCNPWLKNKQGAAALGLHTTDELCSKRELLRSEFYADWLVPQAIEGGFGTNVFNDDRRFMFLSILRAGRGGEADAAELRLLERLQPHLRRAIELNRQLVGASLLQEALISSLDALPNGFILLGEAGRIIAMNRQAEDLLARQDGLSLCHGGRLVAARLEETNALQQMIAGALNLRHAKGEVTSESGGAMAVSQRLGRPLQVLVSPLPWRGRLSGAGLVALLIHDPETRAATPADRVRALYGLTAAEARLAVALAEGESLKSYAETGGITLETARSRLKQVMGKMDVHRQAELVRAVVAIPAIGGNGIWEND